MKQKVRRIVSVASGLVVGAAALAMFAGCNTKHPKITITYEFNGSTYEVDYTLSRNDAPQTVQHFLELADAGYYDGMCIHDYSAGGTYLYSGGYRLVDGELEEVNYFETVKKLEEEKNITFTQSVWMADMTPLYTVYGEFANNGVTHQYSAENQHKAGALVMYYTDKGAFTGDVTVKRADGGDNNITDGKKDPYDTRRYATNSATSLFYTYTGSYSSTLDNKYCVFGMADDYEEQLENGLLAAIDAYVADLADDQSFTTETNVELNGYEPFEELQKGDFPKSFATPIEKPIIIRSVKVKNY